MTEDQPVSTAQAWVEGARAGDWSTAAQRGARRWAAGWVRSDRCPADPGADHSPGRRGWRQVGGRGAEPARRERHRRRVQVIQQLRRAGYVARHRWARTEGGDEAPVYLQGPAAGLRVVDPWDEARTLASCGARWAVHLRLGASGLSLSPAPLPCGRAHLCPVCAADRAEDLARAVRATVEHHRGAGRIGAVALVTLTQRADPHETLAAALERLRAAFRALRKSDEWRHAVAGAFWGIEVTHKTGRGWHAHAHVVVGVEPHKSEQDARAGLGRAWHRLSDQARPGYGWRPRAGGCQVVKAKLERPPLERMSVRELRALAGGGVLTSTRWGASVRGATRMQRPALLSALSSAWRDHARRHAERVVSWAGGWWRPAADLEAVKQAAKYPTPAAMLSSVVFAEWLAVARSRRWHDGCGLLRGALRQAREMQAGADEGGEAAAELGPVVCVTRPGGAPDLDALTPDLGWRDLAPAEAAAPRQAWARWQVAADWQGSAELAAAVEARGWRYAIGPAAGQREDLAPVRLAADGEAPDAPGLALWVEAWAAGVAHELRAAEPAELAPVERTTKPRRRRRRGELRRGSRPGRR
jgi:hypothetical protein